MRTILLATHNPAKLKELKLGTQSCIIKGFKVLSLNDLNIKEEPEETGTNTKENSFVKAYFYANLTSYPTIADDGAIEINALNGEPGVKSKRWLGYEATDEELIGYTLKRLKGLPKEKRTAFLKTCLCYFDPKKGTTFFEKGEIKGYMAEKPSKIYSKGYPYRALFIVDKYDKYYDELTEEEHFKINHRLKALKKLIKRVINL